MIATPLAIIVIVAGLGAATPEVAPADAPELTKTLTIPLPEGKLALGRLVGDLLDEVGIDGSAVRDKANFNIDVGGKLGQFKLDQLAKITRGIVTFTVEDSELLVIIDRLKLRQEDKQLRTRLRRIVENWFPEQARQSKANYGLKPVGEDKLKTHTVVLIHGLDEPGDIWTTLKPVLSQAGYSVAEQISHNDQSIAESATFFAEQLRDLKKHKVKRITIIAHSMGGLVSREVLTNTDLNKDIPQVRRLMMIGTPNHGSEMARFSLGAEVRDQLARALSGDGVLFGSIFDGVGEAQIDLLPESEFLQTLNARAHPAATRYTIIAGRLSPVNKHAIDAIRRQLPDRAGGAVDELSESLHSLSDGLGDGCVSLASARLDGVEDTQVVHGNHITIIQDVFGDGEAPPAIPIILERLAND